MEGKNEDAENEAKYRGAVSVGDCRGASLAECSGNVAEEATVTERSVEAVAECSGEAAVAERSVEAVAECCGEAAVAECGGEAAVAESNEAAVAECGGETAEELSTNEAEWATSVPKPVAAIQSKKKRRKRSKLGSLLAAYDDDDDDDDDEDDEDEEEEEEEEEEEDNVEGQKMNARIEPVRGLGAASGAEVGSSSADGTSARVVGNAAIWGSSFGGASYFNPGGVTDVWGGSAPQHAGGDCWNDSAERRRAFERPKGREWKNVEQAAVTISADDLVDPDWRLHLQMESGAGSATGGRKRRFIDTKVWTTDSGSVVRTGEPSRVQKQKHQINWLVQEAINKESEILDQHGRCYAAKNTAGMKYGW